MQPTPDDQQSDQSVSSDGYTEFCIGSDRAVVREGVNRIFLLNPSAAKIWDGFLSNKGVDWLASHLADFYKIPRTVALRDVENAQRRWREEGLIGPLLAEEERPATSDARASGRSRLLSGLRRTAHVGNYRLGSTSFRLRCADRTLWTHLDGIFGYLQVPPGSDSVATFDLVASSDGFQLLQDGLCLASGSDLHQLLATLIFELNQLACSRADWLFIAHAAAATFGGCGLMIPGRGGIGKTTLTAALLDAGFDYLSDDTVPIEAQSLKAIPIPLPLTVKDGSWPLLRDAYPVLKSERSYRRNDRLVHYLAPPRVHNEPQPIEVLVVPIHQRSAAASLNPLSAASALAALLHATPLFRSPLRHDDADSLIGWIESLSHFECVYDRPGDAARLLRALLT